MLKNKIETLKEEKNKLKHDMNEKDTLIKVLTGKLNEERNKKMWQTETRQTRNHQSYSK